MTISEVLALGKMGFSKQDIINLAASRQGMGNGLLGTGSQASNNPFAQNNTENLMIQMINKQQELLNKIALNNVNNATTSQQQNSDPLMDLLGNNKESVQNIFGVEIK